MSFALVNLRELDDAAARFGYSETQEARFAAHALGARSTGVSHHVLRPGRRQPFAHRHREAEEVYVVLAGGGRAKLDDEIVQLRPLDALRVAPGVTRRFEAGPEGLEFLAVGPRHEGDAEMVPGFWEEDQARADPRGA